MKDSSSRRSISRSALREYEPPARSDSAKGRRPLERENVRQSIQVLHSTGRFADIQAEAERTPDGQVVIGSFARSANFFVGEIFVEGAPNPPAANQVVNASKLQLGELFTREKMERGLGQHQAADGAEWLLPVGVNDEEQPQSETQQMDMTVPHRSRDPTPGLAT